MMVDRLVGTVENSKRIEKVQNCFGMNGVTLAAPERVLVGEGVLKKRCRKKLKPRQMYLFNDILVYGSIIIKNTKFARQHIIPLENVKIEDLTEGPDSEYGWLIRTPTKSFAVYAASVNERREWVTHITMCVRELLEKTGTRPISTHAAVWTPDESADCCMHCKKSHFTLINRRHHCRNCGTVVCGSCSKNSLLLANISTKPSRVCDSCYAQYKQNENDNNSNDNEHEIENKPIDESYNGQSLDDLSNIGTPTFYRRLNQS